MDFDELIDIDESTGLMTDEYLSKKCLKFISAGGVKSNVVDAFFDNLKDFAFYADIAEDVEKLNYA